MYAVPYEGEEVYLHWANKDQYYIKTTEYLRDYAFKLSDGRRVHFKLVEANTETDNKKEQAGQERRFILDADEPLVEEVGADGKAELFIRFHYKPVAGEKKKQAELNGKAVAAIFASKKFGGWTTALSKLDPSPSNSGRTLLEKHLNGYTARNTFDYFIHKDLGGFLRRELDFFIKNEVMHLDDIESDTAPRVDQYLAKIRVLRTIAFKVIEFVTQLETFQKRLWLKTKFVLQKRWLIRIDLIPENFLPEVIANVAQVAEWERLCCIKSIKRSLHQPGYSKPLSVEFLQSQPTLFVDTEHFDQDFVDRLIASIDNLADVVDGVLVKGENFQALRLLENRYAGRVNCLYIDPPYNAQSSEIAYKNTFKHSSWLSLIQDRLQAVAPLLAERFVGVVAIDEVEQEYLGILLSSAFATHDKTCVTVVHNATGQQGTNFSATHEYAYFIYPKTGESIGLEDRTDKPDIRPLRNVSKGSHLRTDAANCFYPILVKDGKIIGFGDVCEDEFHPKGINVKRRDGVIEVYPIDPSGVERKWVFARNTVESILSELSAEHDAKSGTWDIIRTKARFNFKTVWTNSRYSANSWGSRILNDILPGNPFTFPKSLYTVADCVDAALGNASTGLVLDYFAGSGTTGHAVIHLNRQDGGNRKFILAEVGEHFDSVVVPRLKRVAYAPEWSEGQPKALPTQAEAQRSPRVIELVNIESYEDSLSNLTLARSSQQESFLSSHSGIREDYTLRYMLDVESRDSLLKIDQFSDPYAYKLKVHRNGETQEVAVDLVETFNWLLGLTVKSISVVRNVRVVEGTNPEGQKVLVLWRRTVGKDAVDNDALNKWFEKSQYSTKDREFDLIYVNGDNHLENVRSSPEHAEATWKVRLIEAEFQRLMFEDCE